jgi:glycosyltransferase involved in cell wall biosynthesis
MEKVFFISKIRLPESRGMSHGIMNTCRGIVESGRQLELVIPNREQTEKQYVGVDLWSYYNFDENPFKVTRLPVVEIPIKHLRMPILSLSFSIAVIFYLVLKRAKVVYLFTECKEILAFLHMVRKIFVVYESHILTKSKYEAFWENLGIGRINLLVTPTKYFADFYLKKGLGVDKVIIENNGINIKEFDLKRPKATIRKELEIGKNDFVVGYGGKFVTSGMEKGIPELLEATKILQKKIPTLKVICLGGPRDYVDKYKAMAKDLDISRRVTILDHTNPQKFYQYLRAFDVCIMAFPWTHHFAFEMSPLKMIEYMASGNPLIATDLPSVREVLEDGVNCLLVKPGDSQDLAKGIERLFKNPKLATKISETALKKARGQTWKNRQTKILQKITHLQAIIEAHA